MLLNPPFNTLWGGTRFPYPILLLLFPPTDAIDGAHGGIVCPISPARPSIRRRRRCCCCSSAIPRSLARPLRGGGHSSISLSKLPNTAVNHYRVQTGRASEPRIPSSRTPRRRVHKRYAIPVPAKVYESSHHQVGGSNAGRTCPLAAGLKTGQVYGGPGVLRGAKLLKMGTLIARRSFPLPVGGVSRKLLPTILL